MFGNKKLEENGKVAMPVSTSSLNSLVHGTKVEGTIEASSDIRIDGAIVGTLICKAKVIVGPTGNIKGEIKCQNAVIEGKFEGTLRVKELLNVRENAIVTGDISTSKLIVQSGAVFSVTCKMGDEKSTGLGSHNSPKIGKEVKTERGETVQP